MQKKENPNKLLMQRYTGKQLLQMRKEMNMSQTELAEMLSLSTAKAIDGKTIHNWEAGKNSLPSWASAQVHLIYLEVHERQLGQIKKREIAKQQESLVESVLAKVKAWLEDK